jgi:DNA polymerase II small subunit/DNA polymerase delta subunit B
MDIDKERAETINRNSKKYKFLRNVEECRGIRHVHTATADTGDTWALTVHRVRLTELEHCLIPVQDSDDVTR